MSEFLPHPDMQVECVHLYRQDGIHMSGKDNDVYLKDLHQELRAALGN